MQLVEMFIKKYCLALLIMSGIREHLVLANMSFIVQGAAVTVMVAVVFSMTL